MVFFEKVSDGINIRVKISPKASRNAVIGTAENEKGQGLLKVAVTAVPEKGKANKALIKLLSKLWKIPKSDFSVISGLTDRNKVIHISGDSQELAETVERGI